MKHCYHCGRITAGEPLFCNTCGRSFDRKLCPRLHPNPRSAEICSRCGSRELSTPQPNVSLLFRGGEWLARMLLGAFLTLLTVFLVYEVITEALRMRVVQNGLLLIGFLIAILWWLWTKLPEWLRKFIRKQLRKRKERHEQE
ncbi:MAG TPA: zinc ribbon domain-containing protein [Candidatus Angelobacter sp.]|nr:zinc ribbon domain-containing protein [Candidatus Angelobacter sp.]